MDVTVSDVIGTAHSNSAFATAKLETLTRPNLDMPNYRMRAGLSEIEHLLAKALSDVLLAQHMLSEDWEDTTYVGRKV